VSLLTFALVMRVLARFGEAYLAYKNKVPRWFGKTGAGRDGSRPHAGFLSGGPGSSYCPPA
jgi:hypothetical protein